MSGWILQAFFSGLFWAFVLGRKIRRKNPPQKSTEKFKSEFGGGGQNAHCKDLCLTFFSWFAPAGINFLFLVTYEPLATSCVLCGEIIPIPSRQQNVQRPAHLVGPRARNTKACMLSSALSDASRPYSIEGEIRVHRLHFSDRCKSRDQSFSIASVYVFCLTFDRASIRESAELGP